MKTIFTFLCLIFFSVLRAQTDTIRKAAVDSFKSRPVDTLIRNSDWLKISPVDSVIYYRPEIDAEYPGGMHAWVRYLVKNLRYPEKAQVKNIMGTVEVAFMVDSTGEIHDAIAISGPEELREESARLIRKSGLWTPAVYNGRKVNSWKVQTINYRLEN